MGWQRFNRGTNIFEVSDDNGASWQPLIIAAAGVNVPPLPANIAYTNVDNMFGLPQTIYRADPHLSLSDAASGYTYRLYSTAGWFKVINHGGAQIIYCDYNGNFYATGSITSGGDVAVGSDASKGNLYTTYPIYPGRYDNGWTRQASWWLGSHISYGLYTNTGLYAAAAIYCDADIHADNGHLYAGGTVLCQMKAGLDGGLYLPRATGGHPNPQVLDAYYEGTWTPQLQAQSGGYLGISGSGVYAKIGRFVWISAYISVTSGGGAPNAGIIYVHGLPYASSHDTGIHCMMNAGINVGGFYMPWLYLPAGGQSGVMYSWIGHSIVEIMSKVQNGTDFRINAWYMTSS